MHAAPPVSYPAGRSRAASILLAAIALAGLGVVVAWVAAVPVAGWRQAVAAAVWCVATLLAWRAWRMEGSAPLRWDGVAWQWSGDDAEEEGSPAIVLDLQACMLLRWRSATGRGRWLWVDRAAAPADWLALRRAVYSRARPEAPDGAKPPMAQR